MRVSRLGRAARSCGVAAALLVWPAGASAMRVSPMVVELSTAGAGATARVEVQNINPTPMPFEARVFRLEFADDGKVTEVPADEDFLVFPPQGALKPGGRQVVRLQWVGGAVTSSRGYYLSINQIPVDLNQTAAPDKLGAQVQLVYHIKVLTTVAPPGAQPRIQIESATPAMVPGVAVAGAPVNSEPPKQPGIAITVSNSGKRYALMAGTTWTIDGLGLDRKPQRVVLTRDDMSHILGAGYVAALNGRRTFLIPTGKPFAPGPIKVRFSD